MENRDQQYIQQMTSMGAGSASAQSGDRQSFVNYQFTPDELRVLKECDYEAFVQRSFPLGSAFGVAAYYAVKTGYLKGNPKWGPAPKVLLGVIVGYFLGKFSYQMKCAEKIMQLPNSQLAEMLKMRRKGRLYENFTPDQGFGAGLALAPFQSASEHYSDEFSKSTSLNLDTERPILSGLDDTQRPIIDGNTITFQDDLPLEPPKTQTSYDELRNRNREDYAKKAQNPYYRPISTDSPTVIRSKEQPQDENIYKSKGNQNKYGDVWTP